MQRVKVLQVITGLGPGGAERLVLDMMRLFDEDRFDVRLVTIVDDLRALDVYGHHGIPVEVFDLKRGKRISALRGMQAFLNDFKPDVIHAHMFHSFLASLILSLSLKKKPAICFTSHNSKHSRGRIFINRILKNMRDADVIFTTGQHIEFNSNRTEIIPNGVQVQTECPMRSLWDPSNKVHLLSVGRLNEQKDPLGLLRAISKINFQGLSLEFVGAGPLESAARSCAFELGIADRVQFSGLRSNVKLCMQTADVFVMHSRHEGMPMALLEAGAEAMPVIATPVGSIPDVLGKDRGWLAIPEKFVATLRTVITDPTTALAAGRRLHAHVMHGHSIQMTVCEHERLYSSIAKARYPLCW